MEKRPFGKTQKNVSLLGFGCMRLPLDGPDASCIDEALATAMVRKAIDRGVNYLDTAWPYHGSKGIREPGASEPFVGRALRDGYRSRVLLATKLPAWSVSSRADMDRILDTQLQRLETDHIDCYLAHNLNSLTWPALRDMKLFDFLDTAKRDGRIRHVGFSFHDRFAVFEDIIHSYDWEFIQIQYNYLDQQYQAGQKGLALAAERGLGIVVMEPLRGGFLVNHVPEEMRAVLAAVRPEWSLADWGLRWLWNQDAVQVVLSGMSTMAQVEENLAAADAAGAGALSGEDLAALDQVRRHFVSRIKVQCTACGYCLPCPAGVNIPKNFTTYNDYFLSDDAALRERTKFFYNLQTQPGERADKCIQCRECETKCPQALPVSDEMPRVAATLCS